MSEPSERKIILPVGDSRLNEFIRRAAPIITSERGLNERSRLKLRLIADSLNLPKTLFDLALEYLRQEGIEPKDKYTRFERAFVNWWKKYLQTSQTNILSAELEQKALVHAKDKYQLTVERARELIHEVAREQGLQRVSLKEAESYLRQLVDEQIGTAVVLNDHLRQRLEKAAQSWGVELNTIDGFIDYRLAENSKLDANPQVTRRNAVLVGTIILMTLVLFAVSWYQQEQIARRARSEKQRIDLISRTQEQMTATEVDSGSPDIEPAALRHPGWSESTYEMLVLARERDSLVEQCWNVLTANDSAGRVELLRDVKDHILDRESNSPGLSVDSVAERQFLGLLLSSEPDGSSLPRLVSELADGIDIELSGVSTTETSQLGSAFKTAELTVEVRGMLEPGSAARTLLDQEFVALLGVSDIKVVSEGEEGLSNASEPPSTLMASLLRAIADRWLDQLVISTRQGSDKTASLAVQVKATVDKWLGDEAFSNRFEDLFMLILETSPDSLPKLQDSIDPFLRKADREQIFAWGQLLKTTKDERVRTWLVDHLANHFKIDRQIPILKQLEQVRQILDQQLNEFTGGRNTLVMQWINENPRLRKLLESDEVPAATPQNIADIAYWGTQALAFSRGHFELFRQMNDHQPDSLIDAALIDSSIDDVRLLRGATFRAHATHRENMEKALATLFDTSSTPTARASAFQRVAAEANRFEDIETEQARSLVRYLLMAESDDEFVAIRNGVGKLRHWTTLHQAMIELTDDANTGQERVLRLCRLLTGETFAIDDEHDWRVELRTKLTAWLRLHLHFAVLQSGESDSLLWEHLHQRLRDEQQRRIRISGAAILNNTSYLQMLHAFTDALAANSLEAEDLESMWQLDAFIARNELHEVILAGRRLIDVVARLGRTGTPQIDYRITKISDWHATRVKLSNSFADQLMLNEVTLLKIWTAICLAK
ncbi:MAG TPA: hypothetical protein PKD64_00315 [Pirellulaceae bacterium]|nr:hypothetical protein [Pirellulaceae bacterium]HMO90613.1 hypothetical protein [Pirellulaceae bacterium]HMP67808.1 hypothetical protein [Pirellulaceae bacterium]